MNFASRLLLPGVLLPLMAASSHALESSGEEGEKRVQYQFVLPEEKTPENVKPEEHNPFESENEIQNRQSPGDTEENRVRDKLLKLPVVGTKRMADGRMRVLLGDIILETGRDVPPVLPEQLVVLKVKNITAQYIELAWQEKRLTGLPPKLMIIPINIAPQVRYQMLGQSDAEAKNLKGPNAKMDLPLRDPGFAPQATPPAAVSEEAPPALRALPIAQESPPPPLGAPQVMESPPPAAPAPEQKLTTAPPAKTAEPVPSQAQPAATTPPSSPALESVVRMLFGSPTPAPK